MVLVLMGVSGSGKTTIGKMLAAELDWTFVEADDFHPPANIEKMAAGTALDDDDRRPWLTALGERVAEACGRGEHAVLACSALKQDYREQLAGDHPECVRFVYLTGPRELIHQRLQDREGHFMDPALIQSQFETLEPPADAIRVDVSPAPEIVADEIRRQVGL